MNNSLYIVRATDKDTMENMEYEFSSLDHAREIYNSLVGQSDIKNLVVLEYDLVSKQYHIVNI